MRRRSSRGQRAGAATCLLALAENGCSFVFAHNPPANHGELRYFDCPSSYVAPGIDTAIAVVGGATALLAYGLGEAFAGDSGGNPDKVALLAIPLVALPVISAVYGYTKVGNCREAKDELVARLGASPAGGQPMVDLPH